MTSTMDTRAAKLALARKKLKDHQDRKGGLKEGNVTDSCEEETHDCKGKLTSENENLSELGINVAMDLVEKPNVASGDQNQNISQPLSPEVNVTELLVSSKRNLELKVIELQSKLSQLESDYAAAVNNNDLFKQQISNLDKNLKNLNEKYLIATEEVLSKDRVIESLYVAKSTLSDENNNLQDQLEFTKTVLTAKETENESLHSQLSKLQNQLDTTQLHIQQITNGSADYVMPNSKTQDGQLSVQLQQKISTLEQQIKILQKERDQINSHYEHYVNELNNQLKTVIVKNEELTREVQSLTNREISLIEQISDMEIRLQNYHAFKEAADNKAKSNDNIHELEQKYANAMETLKDINNKYEELQKQLADSEAKVTELSQIRTTESTREEISVTKLTADIASDKIAAQRATEQNKKLKTDVQDLESAFIKLSQDKLELVEKLTAEKYLNRELTIKLAEIEEKAKTMHVKLMAKDEEMIRLQTNCRELEKQVEQLSETLRVAKDNEATIKRVDNMEQSVPKQQENNVDESDENKIIKAKEEDLVNSDDSFLKKRKDSNILQEHAMLKLQERFLKIMEEVADLSDEKHRLEHIILQLQNETDTICEYVALYQQQRSLLKKRDEERSAQIKLFQVECDRLRKHLEELGSILLRFAGDTKLTVYFKDETKQADMAKVMDLITNLKHNSLIDPKKINFDLNNFYPCSCCSGQLIDV